MNKNNSTATKTGSLIGNQVHPQVREHLVTNPEPPPALGNAYMAWEKQIFDMASPRRNPSSSHCCSELERRHYGFRAEESRDDHPKPVPVVAQAGVEPDCAHKHGNNRSSMDNGTVFASRAPRRGWVRDGKLEIEGKFRQKLVRNEIKRTDQQLIARLEAVKKEERREEIRAKYMKNAEEKKEKLTKKRPKEESAKDKSEINIGREEETERCLSLIHI